MALNEAINNEDIERGAALREQQNKAREFSRKGNAEIIAGKAMRFTGDAVDRGGRTLRKGGTSAMKAGARLSSTGVGAIAGVPLMAVGGLAAGVGLGAQGIGKTTKKVGNRVENSGKSAKLRAALQAKRNAAAQNNDGGDGLISGPVQGATSGLLKSSWINLIPSFGLTLGWINFHAFMRWIFPSFFCKLGREWIPKFMNKFVGRSTALLEIGEKILLVILDVMAAAVVVIILMVIMQVAQTVSKAGSTTNSVLSAISPAYGLISAIYQMAK